LDPHFGLVSIPFFRWSVIDQWPSVQFCLGSSLFRFFSVILPPNYFSNMFRDVVDSFFN
jgi:hypothetical protein